MLNKEPQFCKLDSSKINNFANKVFSNKKLIADYLIIRDTSTGIKGINNKKCIGLLSLAVHYISYVIALNNGKHMNFS